MTAGTVLPVFFAIGIAFIPLGVALLITSNNVSNHGNHPLFHVTGVHFVSRKIVCEFGCCVTWCITFVKYVCTSIVHVVTDFTKGRIVTLEQC